MQTNFKLSCEKEISIAKAKLQNLYAQFPHRNFNLGVEGAQLEVNILVIFQTNWYMQDFSAEVAMLVEDTAK